MTVSVLNLANARNPFFFFFVPVPFACFLRGFLVPLATASFDTESWSVFAFVDYDVSNVYRRQILGGQRFPMDLQKIFFPTEFDFLKYLDMSAIALGR